MGISNDKNIELIAIEEWAPAEVQEVDLYQKREKIYTRKIEGVFQRIRLYTGWPLLLGYFALPWISWGDHPAVLFDLPARQFHIFSLTIWPQDLFILGLILMSAAFALFAITALAGRVWCGYTCPQTIWTAVFMWIEQKTEGTRNQRMRLDNQSWSFSKARKKITKHAGWLFFSLLTGVTFVGYFTPIAALLESAAQLNLGLTAFSWVMFFTLATYINAGWAREQLCTYVCPYARFQSAMFDAHTLIISYDRLRGEPRGSRKRGIAENATGLGACIDCQLCVQVCPTGIDIRNGLQYECISCALCIDACDSVMEKMGYAKGLISYTTEAVLEKVNKSTVSHVKKDMLFTALKRWKVLGYSTVLLFCALILVWRIVSIQAIELSIIPDRLAVASAAQHRSNENRYTVKIVNKSDEQLSATLALANDQHFELISPSNIIIEPAQLTSFPVRVIKANNNDSANIPVLPIEFKLDVDGKIYKKSSRFIAGSR